MIQFKRNLTLDIYDYGGRKICPLYDSDSNIEKQAADVYITKERNGWKELNFTLPGDDYRKDYLQADYKIKAVDDEGEDWYLISSPKVTHNGKGQSIQVNAGHVCQLLKQKNLSLEFSDEYGNNIGTAAQLLQTVLNGTGWSVGEVADFFEKDGSTVKKRSLKASAKTGAFKLISMIGDLFEAKPVYHGGDRTVDLLPMNPFSYPKDDDIYSAVSSYANGNVLELNYGKNVSNVTRQLKTENMVTKLYAYGAYGDDTDGYCGIDECGHTEHVFTLTQKIEARTQYYFTVADDSGVSTSRCFTPSEDIAQGDVLIWSCLDPASQMYIWDDTTKKAYAVDKGAHGAQITAEYESRQEQNWFSFLMDFTYYSSVGLISGEMLQTIARFQRNGAGYLKSINEEMTEFATSWMALSNTIGEVDFVKLDVDNVSSSEIDGNSYATITLTDDRIKYRSDYNETDHFKWRVATALKSNGDAVNSEASLVYAVHKTTPTTYDRFYIRSLNDIDDPSVLVLWADADKIKRTDELWLFSSNNVNGLLGALESKDEALKETIDSVTTVVTVTHPVFYSAVKPAIVVGGNDLNTNTAWFEGINTPSWATYNKTYAWWYKYDEGEMYFCYYSDGDRAWKKVTVSKTEPAYTAGQYWYNLLKGTVSRGTGGKWAQLEGADNERLASLFGTVYWNCISRDMCRIGQYTKYTVSGAYAPANWYMTDEYGTLMLFSSQESCTKFEYDTTKGFVTYTPSNVAHAQDTLAVKNHRPDNVSYHSSNIFVDATYEEGFISTETGGDLDGEDKYTQYKRSNSVSIYPSLTYNFTGFTGKLHLFYYTLKHDYLSHAEIEGASQVYIPPNTRYVRVASTSDISNVNAHIPEYETAIIANEETYYFAGESTGSGELKGLVPLIDKFKQYADLTYGTLLNDVTKAQEAYTSFETEMQNALGDLFREGYWQESNYVDGDEQKLYDDATDNIKEVAKPEATYAVNFLDLRCADPLSENNVRWPEFDITSAAHLIDTELNINCWAYIDKISKYYDQPWKTTISINTNLTTASQHSFTDVMTNIANVASQVKAKETVYDRATALSGSKKLATDKLEGTIDANKLKILGGSSTWYTDDKGNMVFESADGLSAMTITGNGFAISSAKDKYGDWIWRSFGTGAGFSADEITTGTLSAELIKAGSITTDKISSTFGETLELTSNKGIKLMVESVKTETLEEIGKEYCVSDTAPENPELNALWLDTSVEPNIAKRWNGNEWVVVNDITQNLESASVKRSISQIIQTDSGITELVSEVFGDGSSRTSRIDTNASAITLLNETSAGLRSDLTVAEGKITSMVSDIDGLDTRVAQTESEIESVATKADGASSTASQTAEKLSWVVQGNTRSEMTLTQDALTYVGEHVDLSLNSGLRVTIGDMDDKISDVKVIATQAQEDAEETVSRIDDEIAPTIENINTWYNFSNDGLIIGKDDSKYSTVTNNEGYHIKKSDAVDYVGSFTADGLKTSGVKLGNILARTTSSGGWVWATAQ